MVKPWLILLGRRELHDGLGDKCERLLLGQSSVLIEGNAAVLLLLRLPTKSGSDRGKTPATAMAARACANHSPAASGKRLLVVIWLATRLFFVVYRGSVAQAAGAVW